MRNRLYLLAVVIAVFMSSCSNDDIPVKKTTTFHINAETAISAFSNIEYTPGELSYMPSEGELRCRVLIYDKDNLLVAEDSVFSPDYSHVLTSNFFLEEGEYTAVFSSDLVKKDKTFENWQLIGREKLSTATFKDTGYIGGQTKILGLSVKHLTVKGAGEYHVDLEPAGALAFVYFADWNRYTNVEAFQLASNRTCDEMTLNDKGEPTFSVESADWLAWRLAYVPYDSNYEGMYCYVFLFPMKNVTLQFACDLDNGGNAVFEGASCNCNIEAAHAYSFVYDVMADEAEWWDYTNDTRSSGNKLPNAVGAVKTNIGDGEGNSLRVMDYSQASNPLEIK